MDSLAVWNVSVFGVAGVAVAGIVALTIWLRRRKNQS
jgi:LPXTG-motif cell wall-anchored protein